MTRERKKKEIDGIDREILRLLYSNGTLVSSAIAKFVGLSPSAIAPRLQSLEDKEILKKSKVLGMRKFKKKVKGGVVTVKSSRGIYWEIDLEDEK